jgi:type I restriction enzyme, R subunit
MAKKKAANSESKSGANLGFEAKLWLTADKLRNNMDAASAIAAELISQMRKSVTTDWTVRESARAKIRVMVRRVLNKFGYPPDLQEAAVKTVVQQAELLCADWASETRHSSLPSAGFSRPDGSRAMAHGQYHRQ